MYLIAIEVWTSVAYPDGLKPRNRVLYPTKREAIDELATLRGSCSYRIVDADSVVGRDLRLKRMGP